MEERGNSLEISSTFYFTYDIRIGLKHEDVVLQ